MPEKITIVVVEDGSLDFEDIKRSIQTECTHHGLTNNVDYEIVPRDDRAGTEALLASYEAAERQRVIIIFDIEIEKTSDMLDSYIVTAVRSKDKPWRHQWPIIVYTNHDVKSSLARFHERFFIASKIPRKGRDVWREFRDDLHQCLDFVS
jgi:hypothetical protein